MAGFTPFTDNYSDMSDEHGYQFEFRCDICGSGYRSEFQRSALGTAGSLLSGASNLIGGLWGASNAANTAQNITDRGARDGALQEGRDEIMPKFKQCPRDHVWVDATAGTRSAACASTTRPSSRRRWKPSAPRSRSSRCARRCPRSSTSRATPPRGRRCARTAASRGLREVLLELRHARRRWPSAPAAAPTWRPASSSAATAEPPSPRPSPAPRPSPGQSLIS